MSIYAVERADGSLGETMIFGLPVYHSLDEANAMCDPDAEEKVVELVKAEVRDEG